MSELMARLISCKYCGRIHASDLACSAKPVRKKETTEITKLRTCRRWDKHRQKTYARDHYLCRVCHSQGRIMSTGLEAHHIVPLAEDPGLAYELENTITLCAKHHKAADTGRISRDFLMKLVHDEL